MVQPSEYGVATYKAEITKPVPGNFLTSWIVEGSFWRSGLSLTSMGMLSTLLLFAINTLVWFALVKAFRYIWARLNASAH